jgi:hypothetical protein
MVPEASEVLRKASWSQAWSSATDLSSRLAISVAATARTWREPTRTRHHKSNLNIKLLLGILGHCMTARNNGQNTMLASNESESPNHKDGEPMADEKTVDAIFSGI